jgi:hypothetical protein
MVTCLIVLARYLGPHTFNSLVDPRREFPVLLFVKGPEKAQSFNGIERGFAIVISRAKLLHEVVDESLISTRISFMKYVLQSVRTRREVQSGGPTSKNDIQTGNVSVLILLSKVVFNNGMAQSQSSFWLCIGQCLAPVFFERRLDNRKSVLPFSRPARNSAAPLCLFWSGFWINSSIKVWRGANDSSSNS